MTNNEAPNIHDSDSAVDVDDYHSSDTSSSLTEDESIVNDSQSEDEHSFSDSCSDMAQRLVEAGSGESLIGSDYSDSEDPYLAEEEDYIINEALMNDREFTRVGSSTTAEYDNATTSAVTTKAGSESGDEFEQDNEFWETLSPAHQDDGSNDNGISISDELFKPQRGFASSPEPLFADFFGPSDAQDPLEEQDDDDQLTIYEEDSSDESTSTISDTCSLSAPLIAHVGTAKQEQSTDPFGDVDDEDVPDEARHDVPLLVIEDLDGRLIYARAGDGEAVFGSDGEFEFAGESEEDSSEDGYDAQLVSRLPAQSHSQLGDVQDIYDDGDTTDEFPDEDMPFPRLLIGSVAPRGGRNARRAREIAARTRLASPRVASPTPSPNMREPRSSVGPSSLSQTVQLTGSPKNSEFSNGAPRTPMSNRTVSIDLTRSPQSTIDDNVKPEMGQFMPALSKSVHRAVIDGSTRAPSPFSALQSLRSGSRHRPLKRRNSYDSLNRDVFSIPKRPRADSANEILARQFNEDHGEVYHAHSRQYDSSPEPDIASQMDLGDLLDEDLLKGHGGDSHPDSTDSESSSNHGDAEASASRRSNRSRLGLNYNAFARWNRIPMAPTELNKANAAVGDHRVDGDRFLVSPILTGIAEPKSRKLRVTRKEKRERLARNDRKSRGTITAGGDTVNGK
ncbi:hypothetical protein MCUN1_000103 [Malassezia cuniculi]|uniref:Uncharacterized protein n=1 Tax=Malassezia cuniculi TaxID=948313 RepID=A0AAF0EQL1_9BASI|nr:hypothetical protein MCUN1_000103 [Malassezia cuniculi]